MKNVAVGLWMIAILLLGFMAPAFAGNPKSGYSPEMKAKIEDMTRELKKFTDEKATAEKNLKTFDE